MPLFVFRFIQEVGKTLGLRHDTMATAAVYFHRFYMFHSFQEFPRYVSCQSTCISVVESALFSGLSNMYSILSWKGRRDTKKMQRFDQDSSYLNK